MTTVSTGEVYAGLDLLLTMIETLARASAVIRTAHQEKRKPSVTELASIRLENYNLLGQLNIEIERAREEGR